MRRAEVPQSDVLFALQMILQGDNDAGFSQAGLARYQYNLAGTCLGPLPSAQKQLELHLAPNKRGQRGCAERLKATGNRAVAEHLPYRHWCCEAL